ncbi:MAG: hypothetical protein PVI37_04960 [Gammaproteobacteria bacterium]|jgi:hypothetical protein
MARIALCWELGRGAGHIVPLRALAEGLRHHGHDCRFLVRDAAQARRHLDPGGWPWEMAPALPRRLAARHARPLIHAQLLENSGFLDQAVIRESVAGWRRQFLAMKTELAVFDHSPGAQLAALSLNLPGVVTGSGFLIPPPGVPMPALRPIARQLPAGQRLALEQPLTGRMNRILADYRAPALASLSELYTRFTQALLTFPELDHYRGREAADYWGPTATPPGAEPTWPSGRGPKLFVYLRNFAALPALLSRLSRLDVRALAWLPDAGSAARPYCSDNIRLLDRPAGLDTVARESDLAIIHGGHGTVATCLLAGCPLLILPLHLEMQLMGANVERLGAGLTARHGDTHATLEKLHRLLNEDSFRRRAEGFASGHKDFDAGRLPERFAQLAGRLMLPH